jgi:hypothetical protein
VSGPGACDVFSAGEARVQDREDEAAAGMQRGADSGDRGVDAVDIGKAEITGRDVESVVAKGSRRGNISVKVTQA